MFSPKRFELISLGDELLLGLTPNSHLTFIGYHLGRRGVAIQRNVVVTDNAEAIASAVRDSWSSADVVITTGGLGPTSDDRTREAVATVLGQSLVHDPLIEKSIAERFSRLGRSMTVNNLKQALRPDTAKVIPNPNGTAPGLWIEQDGKLLIMLPGPPNELHPMFLDSVLPRLAEQGDVATGDVYLQIRTAGVGESSLETLLEPIFAKYPGLNVAYCAHQGQVDCRLNSPDGHISHDGLQAIADQCADVLGENFICFGHDTLVEVIADLLRAQDWDLAVAESCTGGLLANVFTDVPGASKFFAGGIICYSNDCKVQTLDMPECLLKQHGAVSAECAVAMATGVAERLGADYGLSITGFAGPCGGNEQNPVGTIYLGLHSPEGAWSHRINYPGSRLSVKTRAVNAALDWLRRELVRATRALPVNVVPLSRAFNRITGSGS